MIVDCAAYREGQRVDVPADPGRVAAVVAGAGSFGWIGMRMPDADELVGVRQEIGWADFPVDEILARHRRPVLDVDPGRLQLVLRTARYDDHQEKVAIGELSVVVTDDWVITARWGQAAPLADLRQELEQDPERLALGPYAVLVGVVTKVVEGFRPSLDGFEQDVLQTELEVFSPDRHLPINRIYNSNDRCAIC
ncbi:MAG: CorA family divalent cation transporter [Ilumatobacteraceae bacterium]